MILVAVFMLFSCSVAVFAVGNDLEIMPSVGFCIGDVNMDKAVNVKDATLVQKHVANLEMLTEDQQILADADFDTKVNIKDATYIQKQVAGLVKPAVPSLTEVPTDFTEVTTNVPTEVPTSVQEPTEPKTEPTTRDTDEPIELPFVPAE